LLLRAYIARNIAIFAHVCKLNLSITPIVLNIIRHCCTHEQVSGGSKCKFSPAESHLGRWAKIKFRNRPIIVAETTATVTWRFADHQANDNQPRGREVDHVVAELYAGWARDEALELNRAGCYEEARRIPCQKTIM
jgi:hypothetical protein